MQYGNSKDMFKEIGIVDSRLFAVRSTLERLHELAKKKGKKLLHFVGVVGVGWCGPGFICI